MASDFTGSFDEDTARLGYHSRLSSQRFDSSIDYASEYQSTMEGCFEEDPLRHGGGYLEAEGSVFSGEAPILPPPAEEGFPLREWRRKNDIRLVEKERKEREMLKVIIEEADAYKAEFYRRWKIRSENIKAVSRERKAVCRRQREVSCRGREELLECSFSTYTKRNSCNREERQQGKGKETCHCCDSRPQARKANGSLPDAPTSSEA